MSRAWEDGQERNLGAAERDDEIAELRQQLRKVEIERDFAKEILVESTLRQAEQYLNERQVDQRLRGGRTKRTCK